MSEFYVGQKVVCVAEFEPFDDEAIPVVGKAYSIRSIEPPDSGDDDEVAYFYLVEITNPVLEYVDHISEMSFAASAFRPLESKSISLFRRIAQGVTDGKPVVEDEELEHVGNGMGLR